MHFLCVYNGLIEFYGSWSKFKMMRKASSYFWNTSPRIGTASIVFSLSISCKNKRTVSASILIENWNDFNFVARCYNNNHIRAFVTLGIFRVRNFRFGLIIGGHFSTWGFFRVGMLRVGIYIGGGFSVHTFRLVTFDWESFGIFSRSISLSYA